MKTIHAVPLVLAALAASLPLQAATAFDEPIPVELAELFLGLTPGGEDGLYSDLPEDFPLDQAPAGFTLLGSLDQANSSTVLYRTELTSGEAREAWVEVLEEADWQIIPRLSRGPDRGFVLGPPLNVPDLGIRGIPPSIGGAGRDPQAFPLPLFPLQLCHDEHGNLQLNSREAEGYRVVTLRRNSFNSFVSFNQPSCGEQIDRTRQIVERISSRGGPLAEYLPRLVLPDDADFGGRPPGPTGGISSNGSDEVETDTTLDIDWELARIEDHFAEQIAAQGWTPDGEWTTGLTAGSSWTRTEGDAGLLAVLTIVQQEPGSHTLKLRLISR